MAVVFLLAGHLSSIRLTGQFCSVQQPDAADTSQRGPHPKRLISKNSSRETGGGQNEGPRSRKWNCHCRSLCEVSLHVRVLSFRLWENVADMFCAVL